VTPNVRDFWTMNRLPQKTSLVTQAAGIIREEIEAGRWSRWLPGEYELCSHLHVSRRTVRAALDQLSEEGVLKCIQGKRREIVLPKSPVAEPATRRVVLLTPGSLLSLNPFGVFLIDHLREHLAEAGFSLETHQSRVPYRARVPHELENLQKEVRPACWVLLQSTERMQRWFGERQHPCLVVGSPHGDIKLPYVDTDYHAVCHHAIGRFLSKGRRCLVLLNPNPPAAGDEKTRVGFLEAAEKANLKDLRTEVVQHDGTVASICSRLDVLIARSKPPTGLLVSRPRHVLTVLGHLQSRGIKIPDQVAVISRDDDSFLEDVVPSVARYSRNPKTFASTVSGAVLQLIHGSKGPFSHKIMPRFINGDTLG